MFQLFVVKSHPLCFASPYLLLRVLMADLPACVEVHCLLPGLFAWLIFDMAKKLDLTPAPGSVLLLCLRLADLDAPYPSPLQGCQVALLFERIFRILGSEVDIFWPERGSSLW